MGSGALADTHALLWWLGDDPRLSATARRLIAAGELTVSYSAASVWEIAIKRAAGRLTVPEDYRSALAQDGFVELPITGDHAALAGALPPLHSDPFDRMIVAQARAERLDVITRDEQIGRYGVTIIW